MTGQGGQASAPVSAYIGLGSNLGDRAKLLRRGLRELGALGRVGPVSRVYETEPVDVPDSQPMFLNQACRLMTGLGPLALMGRLHEIEIAAGRDRSLVLRPREMDLDLLVYGDDVIASAALTVPHAKLAQRAFVLVPLAEIAPDLVLPGTGQTLAELLRGLDASTVRAYRPEAR